MKVKLSGVEKDFLVSNLRSQLITLQQVLDDIQFTCGPEFSYAVLSLRRVESDIRNLRVF